MTAQEFYDKQRKSGFTGDITTNPDPDYGLSFYENIFWLMEEYARQDAQYRYEKAMQSLFEGAWPMFEDNRIAEALRIAAGKE